MLGLSGTQQTRTCTVEDQSRFLAQKKTIHGAKRASEMDLVTVSAWGSRSSTRSLGWMPACKHEFPRRGTGAPWETVDSRWGAGNTA